MTKHSSIHFFAILIFIFLISGCSALLQDNLSGGSEQTPVLPTPSPSAVANPTPVQGGENQIDSLNNLVIWLPAEFNPDSSPAGEYLQNHISQYIQDNPEVNVEIRVKSTTGPEGMLSSLEKTLPVAPLAAPALILLPQSQFQIAVEKNLVMPLEGMQTIIEDEDWYDFARKLAEIQNQVFGLPFAADAMILLYRPGALPDVPTNWNNIFDFESPLLFSAGDEKALFALNLYLSLGGQLYDEDQRVSLDVVLLKQVLDFFAEGRESGTFPSWITGYDSDGSVWIAMQGKTANLAISWTSNYLSTLPADVAAITIPSLQSESVTLVSGWLWAYSDPYPQRNEITQNLLNHLTDSDFMAEWTYLAGYLPVRPSGMSAWENQVINALLRQATVSAQNLPSMEILEMIGPALSEAIDNVLSNRYLPAEAAQIAIDQINTE